MSDIPTDFIYIRKLFWNNRSLIETSAFCCVFFYNDGFVRNLLTDYGD